MINGEMLIAGVGRQGSGPCFRGFDPAVGVELDPAFNSAIVADLDDACRLAAEAAPALRGAGPKGRAVLLECIVARLQANGDAIAARAIAESGLPRARIEGELGRTCNQLLMFAQVLGDGTYLDRRIDPALPNRTPPRPDLRLSLIPLGPVAVFGASNFPLAFSVAGGDTASALAAGCPVVAKAHPAHPGTSELVGRAIAAAVAECRLPGGVFSLLFEAGLEIGAALVADPRIKAVGFTGSRTAGLSLVSIAQRRPEPIPVYAEMSSINPVVLLPGALEARGPAIAQGFAGALTLGAGQFCTNPGLVLAVDGPQCDAFVAAANVAISALAGATMLTPGIHRAFCHGVEALAGNPAVTKAATGVEAPGLTATPALFATTAAAFLADPSLHEEVFGAASLMVRCRDVAEMAAVLGAIEGQLTIAIHAEGADDLACAASLLPIAEAKAGRVLFNGFGTGVEVCDAMVHGGPWPASSDARTTSVGSMAIARFLRPVCYQDVPLTLLPVELHGQRGTDQPPDT